MLHISLKMPHLLSVAPLRSLDLPIVVPSMLFVLLNSLLRSIHLQCEPRVTDTDTNSLLELEEMLHSLLVVVNLLELKQMDSI